MERLKMANEKMKHIIHPKSDIKQYSQLPDSNISILSDNSEDKLLKTAEYFHQLYSHMNEGMAIHELIYDGTGKAVDYRIIDVNPAFSTITGISKESADGKIASVLYNSAKPPFLDIYANVVVTGIPKTFEIFYEPMNKYFNITAFAITRNGFVTIFSDRSEHKQAEAKAKYLSSFPEFNPMIIIEIDLAGKVSYLNPAAKSKFPDLETLNISHPYLSNLKYLIESPSDNNYLLEPHEAIVNNRYYLQNLYRVDENSHIRIYGIDITNLKQAENTIQKQNSILRSIIESPNTPIFSVDRNYQYTSFNSSHASVMKSLYNADIEMGHSILEYHTNSAERQAAKNNIDIALHGESFTIETWIGDTDPARRYFEISHNPVKGLDDQIIGAAIFAKDSTERKNIQDLLENSKSELEERVKERTTELQIANDFLNTEISARKAAEIRLAERLKELQCLYNINGLDDEEGISLEYLYQRAILIITQGYQFSNSVCVRVSIDGETFQTSNWENTSVKQISNIRSKTSTLGSIEVGSLISAGQSEPHVFLDEEQIMLNAVGELLGSINQRRRTEEELKKSRQRLSMAMQISSAGIYEFSTHHESYYVDERWADILGYKPEELPKANKFMVWYKNHIHPEDREQALNSIKYPDQKFEVEFRIKHKSGEWRYVRCISTTVFPEGFVSGQINGIMLDITESKLVEKKLLLNNEIMKLFWDSSNVKHYMTQIVNLIREWCKCDCVGTRLVDHATGTIPYTAYKGFDDTFIQLEGVLSLHKNQCACARIIAGKPEPQDIPVLTPSGSLYLSNSKAFFDNLSGVEKARYRGTCIQSGFQTIAVIPISHGQTIFGAIHIADDKESALSVKEIEALEYVASLIGQGLYRFDIEERIRTSQESLANAQKIAHIGNWEWDLLNNDLIWSDEVYRIFGKSAQGFTPTYQIFLSFIFAEDRDAVEKAIDAALYHQQPYNIEHRILLSDETIGFVQEQGVLQYDESGQPLKMTGTIQDITVRKMMEKQLLESSNYARTLIEVSLDPLVTINSEGKIMDVNKATETSTGLTRSQLIGTNFVNYFSEPEKAREGYMRVFSEGYVRDYPLALRNVDGKAVEVLYNASLYRNRAGEVQGVFAAARDITQVKKIEEELHALSRQIVIAQENERRAIARELHDEIGQSLTALKILVTQSMRLPADKRESTLKDAYSLASELLQQVRELSLNLRPSMLDDLGLLPTLIWHFDRYTSQSGILVDFEHDGLQQALPPEINTTVYRIIQEALTNVVRHANTKKVSIKILFNNPILSIRIEDKGRGFSLPETNIKATAGLSGMRERVLLLGGKLILDTAPKQGTRIYVELPVSDQTK
jgi:PAS domain S-box-containing protein